MEPVAPSGKVRKGLRGIRSAIVSAFVTALAIPLVYAVVRIESAPPLFIVLLTGLGAWGLLLTLFALRKNERDVLDFVAKLSSRLQDATVSRGHLVIGFDNAVIAKTSALMRPLPSRRSSVGRLLQFAMFFDPQGAVIKPPVETAAAWLRGVRGMKRVKLVTRKRGEASVREEIEWLRVALGASWGFTVTYGRREEARITADEPQARALASFFFWRLSERAENLSGTIDSVAAFLRESGKELFRSSTSTTI